MILELDEEELGETHVVALFFCTLDNLLTPESVDGCDATGMLGVSGSERY
jgi:hypothetical protein